MSRRLPSLMALVFASLTAGCPDPLEAPHAVISGAGSQGADHGDAGTCGAVHRITTHVGEAPQIHGSCSHDPEGLTLSYHWMLLDLPNGSVAQLQNEQAMSPHLFPDVPGHYRVSLIVSNGTLTSHPAYVDVEVVP